MKTRRERRKEKIQNFLAVVLMVAMMVAMMFMFLFSWAEEKPVTLHDHTQGFEQQFADTNWATGEDM